MKTSNRFQYIRRTRAFIISERISNTARILRDAPPEAQEHDILVDYLNSQVRWLTRQIEQLGDTGIELSAIEERKLVYTLEAILDVKRELRQQEK